MHYTHYVLISIESCVIVAVVSDDEFPDPLDLYDPAGSRTPPTPPVEACDSHSGLPPSPIPAPMRQRAMAQLRPVSIPEIVCNMAGKDPIQKIAEFDRHYMPDPDGQPAPDASARGNANDHRSDLKRKADGISRSLSEVFAYLTHGTASLEEAKKLLTIITNVNYIDSIIYIMVIMFIMIYLFDYEYYAHCLQLDFKPADIKHSSLRTMAKDVRRAMLPDNHEVLTKSFAEGIQIC